MSDRFYAQYRSTLLEDRKTCALPLRFTGFVRTCDGSRVYECDSEEEALELVRRLNDAYELGQQEPRK